MNTIIDLNSEVLVDRSRVGNPYLRLLLTALGQELATGSPWVALDKRIASADECLVRLVVGAARRQSAAA